MKKLDIWKQWMARGGKSLTEQQIEFLSDGLAISRARAPKEFFEKFKSEFCAVYHTGGSRPPVYFHTRTQLQILASVGKPYAMRIDEDAQPPAEYNQPPTLVPAPTLYKYSSGLMRLPNSFLDSKEFDWEAALAKFFGAAFAYRAIVEGAPATRVHFAEDEFQVVRLDERFIDFGEVAFIAWAWMGFAQ